MDTNETLSALFAQQQTNQIDLDGPLYSLFELPSDARELTIRFLSGKSQPPQGVRLKVRGGTMTVGSTTAVDLVLWQDTAPELVQIKVTWKSRGARSLRIWNAWRVQDVTQAWLGNAGMRVSAVEGGILQLRCSDGEGDPDFDDLIAEVEVR
jgi:hypothetical protein